jgi:hypothetical protein
VGILAHYYCITSSGRGPKLEKCNCQTIFKTSTHSEINTEGWLKHGLQYGWAIFEQWSSDTGVQLPALNMTMSTINPTPVTASLVLPAYTHSEYYSQMSPPTPTGYSAVYSEIAHSYAASYAASYSPYASQWSANPALTPTQLSEPYQYNDTRAISIIAEQEAPVRTVSLGIVISNLHYKMTKPDLIDLLNHHGFYSFSYINFKTDSKGQCSGAAVVGFLGSSDASAAATALDKLEWSGRPMKAKLDRNRSPVSDSNPPIANGSF